MPVIPPEKLVSLQKDNARVRNFTLLAHVDHGKTTLADSLLASNGIISNKLAGTVRFLDFREDEIIRGITMKSSAVSLYFNVISKSATGVTENNYLINLIDSPGHVDFSSEVSSASRLCDGAFILVDAVEGVCSQTVTVLRQAWIDKLKMVLVINKLDRLITELKLTTLEAHYHLMRLVEQVNAVIGTFYTGELMNVKDGEEAVSDEDIYFVPEKGNVIFASAYDGWAFYLDQFSEMYETKVGFKRGALTKFLWGDYYLDPKTKRVLTHKQLQGKRLKPMFVQFVLENIWAIYDCAILNRNLERVEKVIKSLGVKVLPRDVKSKDPRNLLLSIFQQWLPIAKAVLLTAIAKVPSPIRSQKERVPSILASTPHSECVEEGVVTAMTACSNTSEAPVVAYISKMIAVSKKDLPQERAPQLSAEEMRRIPRKNIKKVDELSDSMTVLKIDGDASSASSSTDFVQDLDTNIETEETPKKDEDEDVLIGFARIFSGTIKVGQKLYVLGPKFDPANPTEHVQEIVVKALYLMMGRELVALSEVPAGNVFAIGGLENAVLRTATLCSSIRGPNLVGVTTASEPIVRVAVEPVHPAELPKLVTGLEMLNQADPCVQIEVEHNGEHVIKAAGELHLERCLKDLRERFAKIDIQSSRPIVPFRETTIAVPDMKPLKDKDMARGDVNVTIMSGLIQLRISVTPLPQAVTSFLENNESTITLISRIINRRTHDKDEERLILEFREKFFDVVKDIPKEKLYWEKYFNNILSFGPKRVGSNILVDETQILKLPKAGDNNELLAPIDIVEYVNTAFQLTTQQGPLCAEPVCGLRVSVKRVDINNEEIAAKSLSSVSGQLPGQVISNVRDAIKEGFMAWSPRLLLAMYSCDIQATTEVLGRVYGVVAKRRGKIVSEEMKEGTPFFITTAIIPVVESFGFADDILKRTSGAASPQLLFHGFEMLDEDPFWVPTTEEELEDLGELADKENIAKKYMLDVRRRKGLLVEQKIVKSAEKQRTLKH
ncbi:GTPase Ria1 [Schizosaccharomyces japonicus yFS275]|uniref:Ribosome assembly protein 1 n=1 Tax=Schizosaccharomyces japonicus (strain yFS275 / FY16936) TaxID=402676 RepID=B6K1Q9_SCHJY|nr:GTPase Ria1 [Schizosaccharomyces japonicus yFS275]EEB07090.1 GTPase Ria1 [Schizosaccharomyces japonicus yFS275]